MKNKTNICLILTLTFMLNLTFKAQVGSRNNSLSAEENSTDVKSKYIINQDYLSKNSLVDYKSYFGDSLKGFDEMAIKVQLLNNNVFGSEYINHINNLKRAYINQKYNLNQPLPQSPINTRPIGGGGNQVNSPGNACVNEDFELTAPGIYSGINSVLGWTIQSGQNTSGICCGNPTYGAGCVADPIANWNAGSPEFSIVATPIMASPNPCNVFSIDNVVIPNSPLGGNRVARLQNSCPTGLMTRIMTQFPVSNSNTLFQFCYAGSWDGVHECCGQPAFRIDMYNCTGSLIPIPCANVSLTPSGQSCQSGVPGYQVTSGVSWVNWQTKYIDLTPYIGQCIRIVVTCSDCSYSGHHGTAYFDARCGGQLIGQGLGGVGGNIAGPVSFCAGSNQAIIAAPLGYSSYQWIAPGPTTIAANAGGTAPTLTISPVIAGAVYTVQLNSPSGCSYIATNTIMPTLVNIAGIGSGSTCPGGASGTATVQGNGSGTGYNYTWLNSNSVTVGTSSTASSLAPGIYSVVITGFGAAGCGSAVATTTVNTAPQGVINLLKPYCGPEAYLSTAGGTNHQWYNGNSAIQGSVGTQANYTVTNPSNLAIYRLRYTSPQGCNDSVIFTLIASAPGTMAASNIPLICPGGTNGSAVISMTPAAGSPPGANSFSVFALGIGTPAYNASLFPTPLTAFTATGLAAGSYSVSSFDGSCKYGTTFNVQALTYNYTVSPVTQTLCSGNAIAAGITFSVPPSLSQYSYSWSPATFLAGNTQQSTIISPTTALGTVTNIIYTVVVTPTIANCPLTKTISIVVANPSTPIFSSIPPLCNTGSPVTINASPSGGTFVGSNSLVIGSVSGILTPTFASIGVNSFTYSYGVFTCVATNTGTFEVSQFNTAALTGSINNLCVTSPAVNLMNIVQSALTGSWTSQSAPGCITNNVFNPASLNTNTYTLYYNTVSTPNPLVCPASSPLIVSVTKTITPFINAVPPFCNNQSSISLTVTPSGGLWSGNGLSSAGIITPSLLTSGTPVVSYVVNIGPCVNSNTTMLNISVFNSAALTGSISNLCVTSNPVNLLAIMQLTNSAVWSGINVQNNNFNPAGLSTGNYTLSVLHPSTPNLLLCPDSNKIVVSVLNPPTPNILQLGPYCNNGGPIQLTVTPNSGTWTPTPYLTNTGVFTSSLSPVGNNNVQYVIGTNTCNSQQTKQISIEAFISSNLVSSMPDQCNTGSAVNLLPISQNNSGVWSGQGVSGTSFNPSISGAGNFILIYNTASSPSGLCPDQSTLSVNVYSLAIPVISQIGPFCNSASPKQLIVVPVGGFFGGANTIGVTTQGLFNPSAAIIGKNIVNYSITAGPCVAYAQTTVSVEKFISADLEKYAGPFCKNNYPVNMNSYVKNPGGSFSGPGITGYMFNPAQATIGNNNIIIYTTNSIPTTSLCPDTSAMRIKVNNFPLISLETNKVKGCVPLQVILNAPNGGQGLGTWNFGDGTDPKSGLTISHTYSTVGTYTVMFSYSDENAACSANVVLESGIQVLENPKAGFIAPEEVFVSNPEVQLINNSTVLGNNTYNWKIDNLYQLSDINPIISLSKVGKHSITLIASTSEGCKDQISKTIELKNDFNVFIPSSFTPNFDKINDEFKPIFSPFGLDTKHYEMEIFNRWGQSLFRTTDVNKGWDGSLQNNSESLKEEVYVYKIKYKDLDGNFYNKMGHLTLLK